jgi:hypothetical protein
VRPLPAKGYSVRRRGEMKVLMPRSLGPDQDAIFALLCELGNIPERRPAYAFAQVQNAVPGKDPDVRAERLMGAVKENEVERLPGRYGERMLPVVPEFARAKVRNRPAEMAQHGIGECLTVCPTR